MKPQGPCLGHGRAVAGAEGRREPGEGDWSCAALQLMELPRCGGVCSEELREPGSFIVACVRLCGGAFQSRVQPFAVWDSTHYSIKPIVSQQPSIMQNSRVPQICQESKGCERCCDYPFMSHFDWKLRRPALLLQRGGKLKSIT